MTHRDDKRSKAAKAFQPGFELPLFHPENLKATAPTSAMPGSRTS